MNVCHVGVVRCCHKSPHLPISPIKTVTSEPRGRNLRIVPISNDVRWSRSVNGLQKQKSEKEYLRWRTQDLQILHCIITPV